MVADEKANILIVDDNAGKRLALASLLQHLNQNLIMAESGQAALRLVLAHEYAVILLDVQMPDMDGFETAQIIRSRRKSEHTPIIFVTAYSPEEADRMRGYSLGAVDYIFAPVVPEILRAKVSVFVDLYHKTRAIKWHEQQLREAEAREHQKRLAETAERLEIETQRNRFFTLSVELLAIAGIDGYFKQVNPTWGKTLGLTNRELLEKPLIELIHPEDRVAANIEWQRQVSEQTADCIESRFLCDGGSHRWLSWSATAFPQEGLMYVFARDVTERKNFEHTLQRKNIELAASNMELESFSYSVSHDLRSPLRAINGYAALVQESYADQLDDDGRRYLSVICGNSNRMGILIDDLLAFSRLGRQAIAKANLDMNRLVQESIAEVLQGQEDQLLDIAVSALPPTRADSALLRQVWVNLISNAIKYTGKSAKPVIAVDGYTDGAESVYSIRDNGIGFDMKYYDKLFGIFQRLHRGDEFSGTGVGLAIVHRVVMRHGGRVWAEGKPNEGSTFFFALPIEEKRV